MSTSRKATYPARFLGRYLEAVVSDLIEHGEHGSQAAVARAIDRDPSTLNRWLRGLTHPRTEEDRAALVGLGLEPELMRHLELLDKLDAWREDQRISVDELVSLAAGVHGRGEGLVLEMPRRARG